MNLADELVSLTIWIEDRGDGRLSLCSAQRERGEKQGSVSALAMVAAGIMNVLFLPFPLWPAALWLFPVQFSKEGVLLPGLAVLAIGGLIFFSAAASLRRGYLGNIEPTTSLVSSGIYRYVRHPMYLSYIFAMLGIDFLSRNLLSFLFTFLAFVPAVIYRAKLEEKALAHRFGKSWRDYALNSGFFLPGIRKRRRNMEE